MEYSILYHPDVLKDDLSRIPNNIKSTFKKAIEQRLLVNPAIYGQPLRQSLKGYHKMRVSDYRVIYKIDKQEIIVFKIGHRKEVYTQVFSRLGWKSTAGNLSFG